MQTNKELFAESCNIMPGGVNSPVRAFKGVGGTPIFMAKGFGQYLVDVEGHQYLDFIGSWGPLIHGHCHPAVIEALKKQIELGISFGAPTKLETELVNLMINRVPNLQMVRLVNSGTEATMSAVRLARGVTGREKLVKFIGHYHGHGDSFLVKAGSGIATLGIPGSPGVPADLAAKTLTLEFNDFNALNEIFTKNNDIAAFILEPVSGNMGCIPPLPGFLEKIRELCTQAGTILIFDEVMTGFRLAMGGAAQLYNIEPDLYTFGKVIGGGLPLGAYGGKKQLMEQVAPAGQIYQAGTLSGNPLATTSGITTLNLLKPASYVYLEKLGYILESGLKKIIADKGSAWTVHLVGYMISLYFTIDGKKPNNFQDVVKSQTNLFNKYFHELLKKGFYLPPSAYETWFLNCAMQSEDINNFLSASEEILHSF